MAAYIGYVKVV